MCGKTDFGCAVASTSSATAEGKICGLGRILAKKIRGFVILYAQRITTTTVKRFVCQYIMGVCYKATASREYKKSRAVLFFTFIQRYHSHAQTSVLHKDFV